MEHFDSRNRQQFPPVCGPAATGPSRTQSRETAVAREPIVMGRCRCVVECVMREGGVELSLALSLQRTERSPGEKKNERKKTKS